MKKLNQAFLAIATSIFGAALSLAHADEQPLPPHNGKCGALEVSNMGDKMNECRVGDVVIVQLKVVPMYCDYRYAIHKYGEGDDFQSYSCVLRVTRKDRHANGG